MKPPCSALVAPFVSLLAACGCWTYANEVSYDANSPVVRISDGLVAGRREIVSDATVHTFLGIPYAQPPVGDLRFEKPRPPNPWQGTYNATRSPSPCMQIDFPFLLDTKIDNSHASEDCLYMNVWRPAKACGSDGKCNASMPVLVFVHGGGFQWGDSSLFVHDLSNFVAHSDVIAVGFNYRVSIFGFLTAGTKEFPGNWGLWDQHLALQWVQKNIGVFGGNPNEVTLAGQSAGAISAALHSISPKGKGLFKRMLLQSGSTMSMIVGEPYKGSAKFIAVAAGAGCYDEKRSVEDQLKETVACLKKADGRAIYERLAKEKPQDQIFPPVNGDDYLPVDPLLANAADKIATEELFLGTVANEGTIFSYNVAKFVSSVGGAFSLTEDYRLMVTLGVSTLFNIPVSASKVIVNYYYGDYDMHHTLDQVLSIFGDIIGDGGFYCPVVFFAEKASKQGIKTYRYQYTHRSSFNPWPAWVGVFHGEDLFFTTGALPFLTQEKKHRPSLWHTLKEELNVTHYTKDETVFMKELISSISAYVRNGKPTIPESRAEWPLYTKDTEQYVQLQPHNYTIGTEKRQAFCDLWKPFLLKRSTKDTAGQHKEQTTRSGKSPSAKLPPPSTNDVESNYASNVPNNVCACSTAVVLAMLVLHLLH
ncbi:acetylcholinesterase-1-like [Dermacentor albipictus]|uniref:acetylcholinesterase-1-like n=1 Tax=Dermacentor albipictus TaxID=60249 RepID=UPI0031FD938E